MFSFESKDKARALAEIARTLVQAGKARSAAQVTATICAIAKWPDAAETVLLVEPSVSTTLARDR